MSKFKIQAPTVGFLGSIFTFISGTAWQVVVIEGCVRKRQK